MTKAGWIVAAGLMLAPVWGGALRAAEPPAGGTISIETKEVDAEFGPVMPVYLNALSDALSAKGFTTLPDAGHAAYVAELKLSRNEVGTGLAHVKTSGTDLQPGGAAGAVGVGVKIPLPTGKSTVVPIQRTRLEISIHKRGEAAIVWHGAAITVRPASTPKGRDEAVAADLAEAVLRVYPAQAEDVVGVP